MAAAERVSPRRVIRRWSTLRPRANRLRTVPTGQSSCASGPVVRQAFQVAEDQGRPQSLGKPAELVVNDVGNLEAIVC